MNYRQVIFSTVIALFSVHCFADVTLNFNNNKRTTVSIQQHGEKLHQLIVNKDKESSINLPTLKKGGIINIVVQQTGKHPYKITNSSDQPYNGGINIDLTHQHVQVMSSHALKISPKN